MRRHPRDSLRTIALLSDLHLGRYDHPDGGRVDYLDLVARIEALAARVDLVVLVGDVLELQHGLVPFAFAHELAVVRRRHADLIQLLSRPGFVRLVGNHDSSLARLAGHHDDLRLDVGGRRLVALHGHQVDVLHRHVPWLESAGSWGAAMAVRAGFRDAWRLAAETAGRVNGMRGAGGEGAFTRRVLTWGRARGATWIVHGHEHAPLLLQRDGVTLIRPGATLGSRLRYALLDVVSGEASLHAERLGS